MALFKIPLVSRLAIALLAPWCFATGAAAAGDLADVQRLLKAGQAAEALRRIEQQPPVAAAEVQWRFVKAVALTDLARPSEAVKIYTRLIEERPDLPEPRNNLAVLYAQQGQFDKARITFESALRTNQAYAAAYDNLGDVHARLATASYARALQVADAGSAAPPSLAQVRELGEAAPLVIVAQAPAPKPAATPASPAATPAPPPAKPAASAAAPAAKPAASAAAPATPPAPAPAPRSDAQSAAQLREAVMRWSAAWSRKDMDAYFAAYQPSFNGGKSRNAWMTDRKTRILGKSQIAVTISGLVMEIDGEKARVQFRQNYRSDKLNVDSNKTLHFVRDGGKWLIDKETAG